MKAPIRLAFRVLSGAVVLVLLAAAALTALAYRLEHRRYDWPEPQLESGLGPSSGSDPGDSPKTGYRADLVARGEYLVNGPGHCADCHAHPSAKDRADRGEAVPLSGGRHLEIFLGQIRFPNITPDTATGIGLRTEGQLARFFRNGIDHRGEIGLPFMMYADLADEDLAAILAYLRTLPPVSHAVPPSRYNVLGKVTRAYFLEPFAPTRDSAPPPPRGRTAEYGGYLVNAVANCASCHTARNMKTGEYTGPRFGGGMVFRRAAEQARAGAETAGDAVREEVVSPNLTPDPETGVMAAWDEAAFIRRFKAGNLRDWSPMPWGPFSRIHEDDLAAMFLYLKGLAPVKRPAAAE